MTHFEFDPGTFASEAGSETGRRVWEFLNSNDSLLVLETTTFLKRPALEGLQRQLQAAFGEDIEPDRYKQMIGRMVRQILEQHGYILDRTGVKIRVGNLFVTAARYKEYPKPINPPPSAQHLKPLVDREGNYPPVK